jgi:tetratricopeptide (TPR) repeat protein
MRFLERLKLREPNKAASTPTHLATGESAAVNHNQTGLELAEKGLYAEALEEFNRATREESGYAEAYYNKGVTYDILGHFDKSIKCYEHAIRVEPDYVEAYNNLGVALTNTGQCLEAIKTYMKAIRLKPDYLEAHNNLGMAYYNWGSYPEAIKALRKALQIEPSYPHAHYSLGLVYIDLRDKQLALDEYEALKDMFPDIANDLLDKIHRHFSIAKG